MEAVSIFNMKKYDYLVQIKSPKWQKRRLDILNRDDFTCQMCGSKETTLHVHHLVYHDGRKMWEYEDWELLTLCEKCHNHEHLIGEVIDEKIFQLKSRGVSIEEINSLLEKIDAQLLNGNDFCITDIIGDCWRPDLPDGYLKKLAERRNNLKKESKRL